MLTGERVDVTSAHFKADPFSFYERLRREYPVCAVGAAERQTGVVDLSL